YGYADRSLAPLVAPELRGLYRVPSYWDARAELGPKLGDDQRLRVVFMASAERSQTELLAADPASRQRTEDATSFGRLYAPWRGHDSDGETLVTPFVGWDHSRHDLALGDELGNLHELALRYGLRATRRTRLTPNSAVNFGVDAAGTL